MTNLGIENYPLMFIKDRNVALGRVVSLEEIEKVLKSFVKYKFLGLNGGIVFEVL